MKKSNDRIVILIDTEGIWGDYKNRPNLIPRNSIERIGRK